ncbi:hypothetical protein ACFL6T_00800 [Candidatus Zixiibacteriota bacterium]
MKTGAEVIPGCSLYLASAACASAVMTGCANILGLNKPDPYRIVFHRHWQDPKSSQPFYHTSNDIFVLSLDEEYNPVGEKRITSGHGIYSNYSPAWSPDGKHIAYVNNNNSDGKLCLIIRDNNGNIKNITRGLTCLYPSWSPNGQQIAFMTLYGEFEGIAIIAPDGSDYVPLIENPPGSRPESNPVWSPDGKWIAFTSYRDGKYEIYKAQVDNPDIQIRLTNSTGSNRVSDWTTEDRILYDNTPNSNIFDHWERDIWQLNPTDLSTNRITSLSGLVADGAKSNGDRIVFIGTEPKDDEDHYQSNLYLINQGGSNLTQITNKGLGNSRPSWGPKRS